MFDLLEGNFLAKIYWADVYKDKREAARFESAASLLSSTNQTALGFMPVFNSSRLIVLLIDNDRMCDMKDQKENNWRDINNRAIIKLLREVKSFTH